MHHFRKYVKRSNKYHNIISSQTINASYNGCMLFVSYFPLYIITLSTLPNTIHNDSCNLSYKDNPIIMNNHNICNEKQDSKNSNFYLCKQ